MQLDPRIKRAGHLATEAFSYLNSLQKGDKELFKTGNEFIDCHIKGLLPSDCILLAANSGIGKTKLLFDTLDQILDTAVNPNAAKIKTLEYALEMKFLNRVLRDTNKLTSKKKSEILTEEFTEEEQEIVRRYYENLQDDRRYVCEESVTTKEFYEMTKTFCEINKESDALVICIDHVLLLRKEDKFEDPLEALTSYINQLRKEFKNVYFILLSQMNRGSLVNIKDKDNSMIPTTAMIYGSSHFEFLCSYIVALVDPFRLGVNSYLKVNPERYDWLREFYGEKDSKGKISFNTLGNMFIFVLKTRESDTPYKNLFIKKMDMTTDQITKMKQSVEVKDFNAPITFEVPVFEPTLDLKKHEPSFQQLGAAFGGTEEDKDNPF
jgi:hypothetical protein